MRVGRTNVLGRGSYAVVYGLTPPHDGQCVKVVDPVTESAAAGDASAGDGAGAGGAGAGDGVDDTMGVDIAPLREIHASSVVARLAAARPKALTGTIVPLKAWIRLGTRALEPSVEILLPRYRVGTLARGDEWLTRLGQLGARVLDAVAWLLADALRQLHEGPGLMHRDVKPDNVFVTDGGDVHLGDFSLVRHDGPCALADRVVFTQSVAALWMRPPELLVADAAPYDYKVDIWSLGATLFYLATGRFLSRKSEPARVAQDIFAVLGARNPSRRAMALEQDFGLEPAFAAFLAWVLDPERETRPDARAICRSPYLAQSLAAATPLSRARIAERVVRPHVGILRELNDGGGAVTQSEGNRPRDGSVREVYDVPRPISLDVAWLKGPPHDEALAGLADPPVGGSPPAVATPAPPAGGAFSWAALVRDFVVREVRDTIDPRVNWNGPPAVIRGRLTVVAAQALVQLAASMRACPSAIDASALVSMVLKVFANTPSVRMLSLVKTKTPSLVKVITQAESRVLWHLRGRLVPAARDDSWLAAFHAARRDPRLPSGVNVPEDSHAARLAIYVAQRPRDCFLDFAAVCREALR